MLILALEGPVAALGGPPSFDFSFGLIQVLAAWWAQLVAQVALACRRARTVALRLRQALPKRQTVVAYERPMVAGVYGRSPGMRLRTQRVGTIALSRWVAA